MGNWDRQRPWQRACGGNGGGGGGKAGQSIVANARSYRLALSSGTQGGAQQASGRGGRGPRSWRGLRGTGCHWVIRQVTSSCTLCGSAGAVRATGEVAPEQKRETECAHLRSAVLGGSAATANADTSACKGVGGARRRREGTCRPQALLRARQPVPRCHAHQQGCQNSHNRRGSPHNHPATPAVPPRSWLLAGRGGAW